MTQETTTEVTPEQYEALKRSGKLSTAKKIDRKQFTTIGVAVIIAAIGFLGGMQYQKSKVGHTVSPAGLAAQNSPMGTNTPQGFGGGQRGDIFGAVTAISSSSITISNTRTGSDTTYTINDGTTVTDAGSASTVSSIKIGDTVLVRLDTSDTTAAASIMLNPSLRGRPGAAADPTSSTDDTPSSQI